MIEGGELWHSIITPIHHDELLFHSLSFSHDHLHASKL